MVNQHRQRKMQCIDETNILHVICHDTVFLEKTLTVLQLQCNQEIEFPDFDQKILAILDFYLDIYQFYHVLKEKPNRKNYKILTDFVQNTTYINEISKYGAMV